MSNMANPAGLEGFEFLEYCTQDPQTLHQQFTNMGFNVAGKHKTHAVTLYQQNNIRFLVNTTAGSAAAEFAKSHGPSVSAMGFRVKDAKAAFDHAIAKGAHAANEQQDIYPLPAIYGVGGSIIYFIDSANETATYARQFTLNTDQQTKDHGLTYIDHVTHNLRRGNMKIWADFYSNIFNFHEVRYFDIEGKLTGLKSQAMVSPCGNIRIPLNESADDKSQIEEFIHAFNGEGIQHIALGTNDIYQSVNSLKQCEISFLDTLDTYYDLLDKRLPNHGENTSELRKLRILLDGETKTSKRLLLQIFTKTMLGPVFFEIIQRKGDDGFGEGNFRALFESMELDQIRRGVLAIGETR